MSRPKETQLDAIERKLATLMHYFYRLHKVEMDGMFENDKQAAKPDEEKVTKIKQDD